MIPPLDHYNRIARYYDHLKRIVFGRAICRSEVRFLESIPSGGNVLILGGGSGEILPILMEMNPDCRVWFVEASSEMLWMARKRLPAAYMSRVEFTHGTESVLRGGKLHDAVITNFFLDLFPDGKLHQICDLIDTKLSGNGLWLVSDFVRGKKLWHGFLLWVMYRFFALTTGIEARRLPAWEDRFRDIAMKEVSSGSYYGGFIKSILYRKNPSSAVKAGA